MKAIIKITLFLSALTTVDMAQAIQQLNNVIPTLVGMQNNGTAVYVGIGGSAAQNPSACGSDGVYFLEPAGLKEALSIGLTAKALGKTLRIDFNQPEGRGGQCKGQNIFLE